ncbi:MAG: PDZ domain-containing protein [Firmicutes bacterium]|nr:PDZ domain-containing protein [Bacillota bacterium]
MIRLYRIEGEYMQKQNKKVIGFNIVEVIVIIVVSAIFTSIATGIIVMNNFKSEAGITYAELLQDDKVKEFLDVYADVLSGYYENVDKSEAINSAISGMMSYLGDKYSTYLDDDATNNLNDMLAGTYNGIGILINQNKEIEEVFDNSPAMAAGILKGDKIVGLNNEDVSELELTELTARIKGSNGNVNLKILRGDELKDITVEVKILNKPAISYSIDEYNDKKIGYLQIQTFSQTLAEQVKQVLNKFDKENIDSVIIDLRGNGGGYLNAATDTASLFLEKGKVIYSLENKNSYESFKDETDEHKNYNIVVLVNEGTASASEILTGALKDSYGVTIVGQKTYGKGKVQQVKNLSDGSMVKYTTAKWLRPNGECVDGEGIKPDYEVEIEVVDETTIVDTQLKKAIEVLVN